MRIEPSAALIDSTLKKRICMLTSVPASDTHGWAGLRTETGGCRGVIAVAEEVGAQTGRVRRIRSAEVGPKLGLRPRLRNEQQQREHPGARVHLGRRYTTNDAVAVAPMQIRKYPRLNLSAPHTHRVHTTLL